MTWRPTHLKDGDTLASLSARHGVSPRQIVMVNGVPWNSQAIEGPGGWVQRTGGKLLSTGRYVFSSRSVILLPPPVAPSPTVSSSSPKPKPKRLSVTLIIAAAVGGLALTRI